MAQLPDISSGVYGHPSSVLLKDKTKKKKIKKLAPINAKSVNSLKHGDRFIYLDWCCMYKMMKYE